MDARMRGSGEESPPVAELAGAVKRYGALTALGGVDLTVRAGEVVALLGPNGAGKTTLVHLLMGLSRPSAGRARLFGRDPWEPAARMRVGAMLQISTLPPTLKVREHIRLISSYYPAPLALAEVIELAGLGGLEGRPFGRLSGGERRRVQFALALCGDPDLLFLDEPTTGLDVEARRALWETIAGRVRAGRSVLLTTHHLEEADNLADRIVLLDRGRVLAEGTPNEIKSRVEARKVVCRTRLPLAEVAALPGVRAARLLAGEGKIELFAAEAERVVGELLARDPQLSGLEVRGADLEEAFLALTGGHGEAPATARPEVAA
jgi:ABC-2 type transport system ATP-binding protein